MASSAAPVRAVEVSGAGVGESGSTAAKSPQETVAVGQVGRHGTSLAETGRVGKVQFMNIHEVRIALTVDDFDRAVAFYRDALRLPEVEAWDRPGRARA